MLDEAHITNIAVEELRQGQRHRALSALPRSSPRRAKRARRSVTLEVKTTNDAAIALYKSFGFEVAGVRKRYYNNLFDAYVMWLDTEEREQHHSG